MYCNKAILLTAAGYMCYVQSVKLNNNEHNVDKNLATTINLILQY